LITPSRSAKLKERREGAQSTADTVSDHEIEPVPEEVRSTADDLRAVLSRIGVELRHAESRPDYLIGILETLKDLLAAHLALTADNGTNAVATLLDSGIFSFLLRLMAERVEQTSLPTVIVASSSMIANAGFTFWSPVSVLRVQSEVATVLFQLTSMATMYQMRRLIRRGLLPVLSGCLSHPDDAVKESCVRSLTNLLKHEKMHTYLNRESVMVAIKELFESSPDQTPLKRSLVLFIARYMELSCLLSSHYLTATRIAVQVLGDVKNSQHDEEVINGLLRALINAANMDPVLV